MSEDELSAAERDAAALPAHPRRVDSYQYGLTPDEWGTATRTAGHVAALVAEVRQLRKQRMDTYAAECDGALEAIAEAITGSPEQAGLMHRVNEMVAENCRLRALLPPVVTVEVLAHTNPPAVVISTRDRLPGAATV